jgi:hypothetical protein
MQKSDYLSHPRFVDLKIQNDPLIRAQKQFMSPANILRVTRLLDTRTTASANQEKLALGMDSYFHGAFERLVRSDSTLSNNTQQLVDTMNKEFIKRFETRTSMAVTPRDIRQAELSSAAVNPAQAGMQWKNERSRKTPQEITTKSRHWMM